MHLRIGETKNYSESDRGFELAVIDTTDTEFGQSRRHPRRAAGAPAATAGNPRNAIPSCA